MVTLVSAGSALTDDSTVTDVVALGDGFVVLIDRARASQLSSVTGGRLTGQSAIDTSGRPGELLEVRGTLLMSTTDPDHVLGMNPDDGSTLLLAELARADGAGAPQLATDGASSFAVDGPRSPGAPVRLTVLTGDVIATDIPLPLGSAVPDPVQVVDLAVLATDTRTELVVAVQISSGGTALSWLDVTFPGAIPVQRAEHVAGRVGALAVEDARVWAGVTREGAGWVVPLDGGRATALGRGTVRDLVVQDGIAFTLVQEGDRARVVAAQDGRTIQVDLGAGVDGSALAAGRSGLAVGGTRRGVPTLWLLR